MVGEVGLAEDEQAGDVRHQVVIDPQAAHGVVQGGVDAHRLLVAVFAGDALVHLEEVAVFLLDLGLAEAADGVGEIEVDAAAARADAAAVVARFLGRARGDVARRQVAVARVLALQVIVALALRDLARVALVAGLERHPDAAIVAERFRHER